MAEVPDAELVRRHLDGDGSAFAVLVERHQRRVYNVALRMLGRPEDAADAAQEVFLTCLRKLGSFRGDAAFTTWLHRVTVNACLDALRRRSREQPSEEPPERPVGDHADAAGAAADVQRGLLAITEEFRAVLVLHDLQGLPYEEVAEALGAPVGTVKSRVHRARVALARALRPEPSTPPPTSKIEEPT